MSSKHGRQKPLEPWLSARADNEDKRFIRVGNSLLLSDEFQVLKPGVQHIYLCMAMESAGKRTFSFSESAAKKYGIAPRTMRKYIDELERTGFIETTANNKHRGQKNEYKFSMDWKLKKGSTETI